MDNITIKNVLIANNHLEKVGGSETFTYALIEAMLKRGFEVDYFTFFKGEVSSRIERDLNVSFLTRTSYDLILTNHHNCVRYLSKYGKIIQTCHGIFGNIEKPSRFADGLVSISGEIHQELQANGFESEIIYNGIDCNRFKPVNPIKNSLGTVLSLTHSESANDMIGSACDFLGINFLKFNKYENAIWDIEKEINKVDLVFGLGRSAYEAMACGRAVIVFDDRAYTKSYSDGYMTPEKVEVCIYNNCSGRYSKLILDTKGLIDELKKFNSKDGDSLRNYALTHFNVDKNVDKYLTYAESLKKKKNYQLLSLVSFFTKKRMDIKIYKTKKRRLRENN